jgi:uncharacterized membrane protein
MVEAPVLHRVLLASIVLGLGFSVYAALEVVDPSLSAACSIYRTVSCGTVLHSGYTTFPLGSAIPDWLWGVAGFVALLALDVPLLRTYHLRYLQAIFGLSIAGVGLAAVFAGVEAFLIHALCPICLGAYLSGVGVLVSSGWLLRLRRAEEPREVPEPAPELPTPGP